MVNQSQQDAEYFYPVVAQEAGIVGMWVGKEATIQLYGVLFGYLLRFYEYILQKCYLYGLKYVIIKNTYK